LDRLVQSSKFSIILVHFLSPQMWGVLQKVPENREIIIWVHGFEAQPWWRRAILYPDTASVEKAKESSAERMNFWKQVITQSGRNWHFIFVSQWLADTFFFDVK